MISPLVYPILGFLCGIIIRKCSMNGPVADGIYITAFFLFFLAAILTLRSRKILFLFFLSVSVLVIGCLRCETWINGMPEEERIAHIIPEKNIPAIITGTVCGYVTEHNRRGRYCTYRMKPSRGLLDGTAVRFKGDIYVVHTGGDVRPGGALYGHTIALRGKLSRRKDNKNPGSSGNYLRRQGITCILRTGDRYLLTGGMPGRYSRFRKSLYELRNEADKAIKEHFVPVTASLIRAMLLGLRNDMPENITGRFEGTGTSHIMAISGMHAGFAALILLLFIRSLRIPEKPGMLLMTVGLYCFTIMTGGRISVTRAVIMLGFLYAARCAGRRTESYNFLAYAAFIISYLMPGEVTSPGFLLSFGAVLSILYWNSVRPRGIKGHFLLKKLFSLVPVSIFVYLGIFPFTAYFFNLVTPLSFIANVFIIPAAFLLILSGIAVLIFSFSPLTDTLTHLTVKAGDLLAAGILKLLDILEEIPFMCINISTPSVFMILLYYMFALSIIKLFRGGKFRTLLALLVLLSANFLVWNEAVGEYPRQSRIVFFSAGGADASLMFTPAGNVVLIDSGSSGEEGRPDCGKNILSPYLRKNKVRHIDLVLVTHAHEDHIGGLFYLMDRFSIGKIVLPRLSRELPFEVPLRDRLINTAGEKGIEIVYTARGDIIKPDGSVTFEVLNPPDEIFGDLNDDSIVFKTSFLGKEILFCGDIGPRPMRDLMRTGRRLKADILKFPHHGQYTGDETTLVSFMDLVSPETVIITNDEKEKVTPALLEYLDKNGTETFITGENGAVTLDPRGIIAYTQIIPHKWADKEKELIKK